MDKSKLRTGLTFQDRRVSGAMNQRSVYAAMNQEVIPRIFRVLTIRKHEKAQRQQEEEERERNCGCDICLEDFFSD